MYCLHLQWRHHRKFLLSLCSSKFVCACLPAEFSCTKDSYRRLTSVTMSFDAGLIVAMGLMVDHGNSATLISGFDPLSWNSPHQKATRNSILLVIGKEVPLCIAVDNRSEYSFCDAAGERGSIETPKLLLILRMGTLPKSRYLRWETLLFI